MPFTFSHPAIILPLKSILKNRVCLTGLVIGSLTPDFEYFLRMRIQSLHSHTIIGTLWFNLPLGILLCFLFHNIIKKPLIENAPEFVQSRMNGLKELNWTSYFKRKWIVVSISILIGAYSHILWDSFTHQSGIFTKLFSLDKEILRTGIPIFKILQHLSTFIGGLIILWYFFRIKREKIEFKKPQIKYWTSIALVTLSILILRVFFGLKITEYGNIIVSGISASLISLTLVSTIYLNNTKLK